MTCPPEVPVDHLSIGFAVKITSEGNAVLPSGPDALSVTTANPGFLEGAFVRQTAAGEWSVGSTTFAGKGSYPIIISTRTNVNASCKVTTSLTVSTLEEKKQKTIVVSGTTAAVGALTGPASATSAQSMSLVMSQNCNGDEFELPRTLHPTQIRLAGSQYAGAIAGNLALSMLVTLLSYVLLWILVKFFPGVLPFSQLLDAQGLTRFPSVALFVFLWLYQGTSYAALHLLFHPPSPPLALMGILGVLVCVIVPFAVAWRIRRSVPSKGRYVEDPQTSWIMHFFIGPGEWVSTSRRNLWYNRYTSMVKPYVEDRCWYALFSFISMFLVSLSNMPSVNDLVDCGNIRIFTGCVFLVMCGIECILWPHARPRDNVFDILINGMTSAALFLTASGYYVRDVDLWTIQAAAVLFDAILMVLLVKVALDILTDVYIVLISKRRGRLQQEFWKSNGDPSNNSEDMTLHASLYDVKKTSTVNSSFGEPEVEFIADRSMWRREGTYDGAASYETEHQLTPIVAATSSYGLKKVKRDRNLSMSLMGSFEPSSMGTTPLERFSPPFTRTASTTSLASPLSPHTPSRARQTLLPPTRRRQSTAAIEFIPFNPLEAPSRSGNTSHSGDSDQ